VHVTLEVKPTGNGNGTATVTYDSTPFSVPISPPSDATGATIELGAQNAVSAAWVARYDNLTCDVL
jgi:hypothetical protein